MSNPPKRIILSRKGFDSTARYGNAPSPIVSGRHLVTIPIPEDKKKTIHYGDLADPTGTFKNLGQIAEQLTDRTIDGDHSAHLDPDVRWESYRREAQWKPLFGQVDQAQSHLHNHQVGPGDIFLFYGLYRDAEVCGRNIRFSRRAPQKHVIWGWLSIGNAWNPHSEADVPDWARYHPHATHLRGQNNTIYVAADRWLQDLPGAGIFPEYNGDLCLTDLRPRSVKPSFWRLPRWCCPKHGHFPLTYHPRPEWWTVQPDCVLLRTKSPGQEYVLDTGRYPEALQWARDLIVRYGHAWDRAKSLVASAGGER